MDNQGKLNIMLYTLNFRKEIVLMLIHLFGFLIHQIFKKKNENTLKYTECTVPGPHNERDLFEFVKMYYNFGRNILEL